MASAITRAIGLGTLTSGSLDLLSAFVFGGMAGRTPLQVLQGVASGPFPSLAKAGGWQAWATGLIVHFSIMSVMVLAFVLAASRLPLLTRRPILCGALYGVGLYLFMYWIVLPMRFPARFPMLGWWNVGNALFSHVICVGIPIALVTARLIRPAPIPTAPRPPEPCGA